MLTCKRSNKIRRFIREYKNNKRYFAKRTNINKRKCRTHFKQSCLSKLLCRKYQKRAARIDRTFAKQNANRVSRLLADLVRVRNCVFAQAYANRTAQTVAMVFAGGVLLLDIKDTCGTCKEK